MKVLKTSVFKLVIVAAFRIKTNIYSYKTDNKPIMQQPNHLRVCVLHVYVWVCAHDASQVTFLICFPRYFFRHGLPQKLELINLARLAGQ